MEITLEYLRRYSNEGFYSNGKPQANALRFMLEEIYKIVDTKEIKIVYPKNLFMDNKQVEIYLFDDNRHIIKFTYENDELNTLLYFFKDIEYLKNKVNCNDDSRSLEIKFINSETIEFSSINDTNSYHTQRFDELIIDIYKVLLCK